MGGGQFGRLYQAFTIAEQIIETFFVRDGKAFTLTVNQTHHASAGGDGAGHHELRAVQIIVGEALRIITLQQSPIPFLRQGDRVAIRQDGPRRPIVQRILDIRVVIRVFYSKRRPILRSREGQVVGRARHTGDAKHHHESSKYFSHNLKILFYTNISPPAQP